MATEVQFSSGELKNEWLKILSTFYSERTITIDRNLLHETVLLTMYETGTTITVWTIVDKITLL